MNPLAANYFSLMVYLWIFTGFLIHLCWFYFRCIFSANYYGPVDVCLLEVGNGGIGVQCGICSDLLIKTPEWCQWHRSGVCVVSVFDLGHVGVCGALFVVNTYFYVLYSSSGFGKSWAIGWLVLGTKCYKKNSAKARKIALMLKIGTLKIS